MVEEQTPEPLEVLELQESQQEIEEAKDVVSTLAPQITTDENGKHKIFFSEEGLKELTQKGEAVSLENDLLGLRVQMVSKKIKADYLLSLSLGAIKSLMEITPTRIPLGVG